MLPSDFKELYENIQVAKSSSPPETIRINQYRLNGLNVNKAKADEFERYFGKHGINTDLEVGVGGVPAKLDPKFVAGKPQTFWTKLASMCFIGKGAPEHYQIVLQLAWHWGLAKTGLQKYADEALGLDCNGFVGNYLYHGRDKPKPWDDFGLKAIEGPDTSIDGYFEDLYARHNNYIAKWAELSPADMYVLGRVNGNGRILPGGGDAEGPGHIAITEPGTLASVTTGIGGSTQEWVQFRVVESTISHKPGLTESWYKLLSSDPRTKVFRFHRMAMHQHKILDFKIARVF